MTSRSWSRSWWTASWRASRSSGTGNSLASSPALIYSGSGPPQGKRRRSGMVSATRPWSDGMASGPVTARMHGALRQ